MADQAPVPDSRAQAALSITRGPNSGSWLPLSIDMVIGRGAKSDLVIDDDSVSAPHARLAYTAGRWWLTDLGSANGTYINDTRLSPNEREGLNDGDVVRLGLVEARFSGGTPADDAGSRPPERTRVAERAPGFRLPLWVVIVVILVAIAAWLLVDVFSEPPVPVETEPTVVEVPPAPAAAVDLTLEGAAEPR